MIGGFHVYSAFIALVMILGLIFAFRVELQNFYEEHVRSGSSSSPPSPTTGVAAVPLDRDLGPSLLQDDFKDRPLSPRSSTYERFAETLDRLNSRMGSMDKKLSGNEPVPPRAAAQPSDSTMAEIERLAGWRHS